MWYWKIYRVYTQNFDRKYIGDLTQTVKWFWKPRINTGKKNKRIHRTLNISYFLLQQVCHIADEEVTMSFHSGTSFSKNDLIIVYQFSIIGQDIAALSWPSDWGYESWWGIASKCLIPIFAWQIVNKRCFPTFPSVYI